MIAIGFLKVLRHWMVRAVGIGMVGIVLAGCEVTSMGYLVSGFANIESKEDLENYVQRAFVRNEYTGIFDARSGTLSTDELYVSWDEFRSFIVDGDTFLKYGLGLILTRYPNATYEDLKLGRNSKASPLEDVISPEEFAYYRLWGQTYLEQIKSRPGNAWLAEREALFEARAKGDPAFYLSADDYIALIKDDVAFTRFLTDNNYAAAILSKDRHDQVYPHQLGPIYTGVTPGTAS